MSEITWADLAIGMLDELRQDYAPMALSDGDGRAAIAKLRAQVATLRAERDAAHATGAAEERARVVALLEKKIALLTVEANDAGDTLAAATGYAIGTLQGLLRKVKAHE